MHALKFFSCAHEPESVGARHLVLEAVHEYEALVQRRGTTFMPKFFFFFLKTLHGEV